MNPKDPQGTGATGPRGKSQQGFAAQSIERAVGGDEEKIENSGFSVAATRNCEKAGSRATNVPVEPASNNR